MFSIFSSKSLVRFSSMIIGEYFSSASISFIPKGVAFMLEPSRYPLSNRVSIIEERVVFVPRFFFSNNVINDAGVKRFGGCVSFSSYFISSTFTRPFNSGTVDSSIDVGYICIQPLSNILVPLAVKFLPLAFNVTFVLANSAFGENAEMKRFTINSYILNSSSFSRFLNSPVGYIEGCAGSDFGPSTGFKREANFTCSGYFIFNDFNIFWGSISLGIFCEDVRGY